MRRMINNNGLTLIEIIVTLAVLGVVISPLMTMFITSQKINNESETEYQAIQLAQEYMEELKAQNNFNSSGYTEITVDGKPGYTKDFNDGDYIIEITVVKEPKPVPENTVDILTYPKVIVKNSIIEWQGLNIAVDAANVDISINPGIIYIQGEVYTFVDGNVKVHVSIETNESGGTTPVAKLNFIDSTGIGKVYISDNGKEWAVNVFRGNTPEIISVENINTVDIIHNITINVYKESKNTDNLVNSLESTNIFK